MQPERMDGTRAAESLRVNFRLSLASGWHTRPSAGTPLV
jgi:hypothetical protein